MKRITRFPPFLSLMIITARGSRPDYLHPNAEGYRIRAEAMMPVILKLCQSV